MPTQREKDELEADMRYLLRMPDGRSRFADGAEYGRKDLARHVIETISRTADEVVAGNLETKDGLELGWQRVWDLCTAILGDEATK